MLDKLQHETMRQYLARKERERIENREVLLFALLGALIVLYVVLRMF